MAGMFISFHPPNLVNPSPPLLSQYHLIKTMEETSYKNFLLKLLIKTSYTNYSMQKNETFCQI